MNAVKVSFGRAHLQCNAKDLRKLTCIWSDNVHTKHLLSIGIHDHLHKHLLIIIG